jgi:hypothetical protein
MRNLTKRIWIGTIGYSSTKSERIKLNMAFHIVGSLIVTLYDMPLPELRPYFTLVNSCHFSSSRLQLGWIVVI